MITQCGYYWSDNGTPYETNKAFPVPGPNKRFNWMDRPSPVYSCFVVQITHFNGNTVRFKPINASDATIIDHEYTVDLGNPEHVLARLPSTLTGLDKDNTCALLFLTDAYVDAMGPVPDGKAAALPNGANPLRAAQPPSATNAVCGKSPCSAGDVPEAGE